MELRLAILADYFEVEPTGRFYISGGFNQVTAPEYPAGIGDRKLIVAIDGEHGESDPGLRIDVRLSGIEVPLASVDFPVETLPEGELGTPTVNYLRVGLSDIVLPTKGQYYFDIYLGDVLKQSLRFLALTPDMKDSIV